MSQIKIDVKTEGGNYPIYIGKDLLSNIREFIDFSKYTKIFILTDENIVKWLNELKKGIDVGVVSIIIPSGETEKNINRTQSIWEELLSNGADRKSLLINLGGGVIGDMGGFAAATYMRGIDFIQIPTTLLSQVDASVGGKVAIDFLGVKNIIGSFQQPQAVIIDTATLKTLPERDLVAGFAEVIKHGFIRDQKYLKMVTSKKPLEFSDKELAEIIKISCEIKSKVVEEDTYEGGVRKILNFGHTIGHAVEALSMETDKPLLHGEAIAIGMVAEAKLSQLKGFLTETDVEKIKTILSSAGLPIKYENVELEKVKELIKTDKKNLGAKIKWTLLEKIGSAVFDIEAEDSLISESINFIK